MDIIFRDPVGKTLGSVGFFKAIATLSYLSIGVVIVITPESTLDLFFSDWEKLIAGNSSQYDISLILVYSAKLFALASSLIGFILAWNRVLYASYALFKEKVLFADNSPRRLMVDKLNQEAISYPNITPGDFTKEITQAIKTIEKIKFANNSGLTNNPLIRNCNWPDFSTKQFIDAKFISNAIQSRNESDQLSAVKKKFLELDREIQNLKLGLKIYISPLQPAIFSALKIITDNNDTSIQIICESETGPQTIEVVRSHKNNLKDNNLTAFIAPLSAFCMAPLDKERPSEDDFENQFIPLTNLANEKQDILYLEGGSSLKKGNATLFYYDNSTAEEYVASIAAKDISFFTSVKVKAIENYEVYKALLNGNQVELQNEKQLEPGDMIVTWPPLTEYFNGRELNNCYLKKVNKYFNYNIHSKIFLFVDSIIYNQPEIKESEYLIAFSKYLNCVLNQMRFDKKSGYFTRSYLQIPHDYINENLKFYNRLFTHD